MINILIVKSILCSEIYQYKRTLKSIFSLFDMIKNTNYKYTVYIVGYIHIKFKSELTNLFALGNNNINVLVELWYINYGKTKILNNIKDIYLANPCNLIFYSDHDILFDNNIFLDLCNININDSNYGILFINQKEDTRHQLGKYYNNTEINSYTVLHNNSVESGDFASGAFIINKNFINHINITPINVYGYDEYYIIQQLNKSNYKYGLLKDIYVVHPYDNSPYIDLYKNWKTNNIKYIINLLLSNELTKSYSQMIQESHNFWMEYF
jgi:hypothetical protein